MKAIDRKQALLDSATDLFGENGYVKTTTAVIAKKANVSEALIFKHFQTKEGLLRTILKAGYNEVISSNKGMLNEKDPLKLIYKVLDLPTKLVDQHPAFWKMQARIHENEVSKAAHENFMQPVHKLLVQAFSELGYEEPEKETLLLLLIVDSLWKNRVKNKAYDSQMMADFVKKRYV
ncbi:MAG: TetR family transcriptional regulator [Crocinitomicaceae bacterium]|nr:TetR family transcriptional regulator [Crocinitomicaceae bacterium]|tara:strand:- start:6511 stop:7041 length:531 start_codon:yes stop_codon:yes gene_type:complete